MITFALNILGVLFVLGVARVLACIIAGILNLR